jgi:Protein of unknown function (DUF4038)/Domain of unknown function (DUF5060)
MSLIEPELSCGKSGIVGSCYERHFGHSSILTGRTLASLITALQKSVERTRAGHVNRFGRAGLLLVGLFALEGLGPTFAKAGSNYERIFESTFESTKEYADPFNDVDVDVIFTRGKESWRVPTFWRGGQKWSVRFAPPTPGDYTYRLESTDKRNLDLNGRANRITITAYTGDNPLLRHGAPRVSANKRYFQYADGVPFFWLGDTLWTGLSDRLPWAGFQQLVADRREKGFTVELICAGLVPSNEEQAPTDPGFRNEGGAVWDPEFKQINPQYFDYADRRVQALIGAGITPAIVGGWYQVLKRMGATQLKKHWRYIIARYGAYPVFWILGGEIKDPPAAIAQQYPERLRAVLSPGWTDIARYLRATDPYHHPMTAHEDIAPIDIPLQDATLTDFEMLQPSHFGWPSIGNEVAQLTKRYSRTDVTKPIVIGEIGYELLSGVNFPDFQRMAFWLAMLNGAAGHTYGAAPTFEVNNPQKPLHRFSQFTFLDCEEGLHLPGSYQVGLSAQLLRRYPWWQIAPQPQWVTPHGTTLLEPHSGPREFNAADFDLSFNDDWSPTEDFLRNPEALMPSGEWQARRGNFRRPYAAGIPGKLRIVYIPGFGQVTPQPPPTIMDLEPGVRYRAFYWEPMLGIKFDLGEVGAPAPGRVLLQQRFDTGDLGDWSEVGAAKAERQQEFMLARGDTFSVAKQINVRDAVVAVDARSASYAAVLLRYRDANNYLAAVYSAQDHSLYLVNRTQGKYSRRLGTIAVSAVGRRIRLSAEVRANWGAASITDGMKTFATPIVDIAVRSSLQPADVSKIESGGVGLWHLSDGLAQEFDNFEVRESPVIPQDKSLNRKLYDARGGYRGEMNGEGWEDWGRNKAILLGAYRPEKLPTSQDWLLVLENKSGEQ